MVTIRDRALEGRHKLGLSFHVIMYVCWILCRPAGLRSELEILITALAYRVIQYRPADLGAILGTLSTP